MTSTWVTVIILFLVAGWMAYWALRAQIWRFGFVFTAGTLCFFATFVPAYLYQFNHNPSLKWVAAACLAAAGILMTLGWALKSRSLTGFAGLLSLALTGLLITALRLFLPPSYGVLMYLLGATALVLVVLALNYDRFFRRDNSRTE